ncbi:hypothetical protein SAMN06269185_1989 [Natronoarchaeum philippinense]|uniref:Uncharacterized protein n=1 Tax=Natronoarchaeum philippinense TaxID=558529 RepID=A0A285NTZ4_NATPI|nr:hypothetical protein [Natronoarchaeum philippinense]SNZ12940.1 hypothetical protein SAMN06269185_1989 [Natronoarchaeum philippinense]
MDYTVQYYDLVLGGVAISLLAGLGVGVATSAAVPLTMAIGGLVAMAAIYHGLFVNGPVDGVDDLSQEAELFE